MEFSHNQVMCFLKFSDDVQRLIFILKKEKLGWLYLRHENSGCLGYHIKGAERLKIRIHPLYTDLNTS